MLLFLYLVPKNNEVALTLFSVEKVYTIYDTVVVVWCLISQENVKLGTNMFFLTLQQAEAVVFVCDSSGETNTWKGWVVQRKEPHGLTAYQRP